MDKLRGFAEKAVGSGQSNTTGTTGTTDTTGTTSTGGNATGGQDYGDKGIAAIEKKFGYSQSAETNERITDGARGAFEKATGKKVPEKFSN